MTARRPLRRRSFLAAVTGTSALMLAGCGQATKSEGNQSTNAPAAQEAPSSDADS